MTPRERGSVLLLALWILAFLGLLGAGVAYRQSIALRLVEYDWQAVQLREKARAAVYAASASLRRQSRPYTCFNQPWHTGPYPIEDESSKLNVNTASRPMLEKLLGPRADLAPAILEWRSPRKIGDCTEQGYTCRHGPFRSMQELLLVRGMTPEVFHDLSDKLTVYTSGPVNINTAQAPVLAALGLPDTLVDKILAFRRGPDDLDGTEDDGVFMQTSAIIPQLKASFSLMPSEVQAVAALLEQNALTVAADSLRLQVPVELNSGARAHYSVVLSMRSAPGRCLYWRNDPI